MKRAALLLLLCACHRKHAPPPPPVVDAAPPPTRFATECALQKVRNQVAWDTGDAGACRDPHLEECVATGDWSGWLLAASDVKIDIDSYPGFAPLCDYKWSLIYVDLTKNLRDAKTFPATGGYHGSNGPVRLERFGAELVVYTQDVSANNIPNRPVLGEAFLWDGAKVTADARFTRRPILEARDVDGDGKTDYVLQSVFRVDHESPMPITEAEHVVGPSAVAHRTADGFSFDDAVAKSLAREKCPDRPKTPPAIAWPAKGDETPYFSVKDVYGVVDDWVICAKLWNLPPKEVSKAFRGCKTFVNDREISAIPQNASVIRSFVCPNYFLAWSAVTIPFTLP